MEGRHYKDMSRAVENGVAAFLDTPSTDGLAIRAPDHVQ